MAKILIADDHSFICLLASHSLQNQGHEVHSANDGANALDLAQKHTFDIILADRYMPGLNGVELTRAIREIPNYDNTPILILSVEDNHNKIQEGEEAGASDWLIKPFSPEMLIESVDRLL